MYGGAAAAAPAPAAGGETQSIAAAAAVQLTSGSNVFSEADAYEFNCTQRGHMNTIENMPLTVGMLLVNWLTFPLAAGILG